MKITPLSREEISHIYGLSRRRTNSTKDYYVLEEYVGELLIHYLVEHGLSVNQKNILDLGSGFGGYSSAFAKAGANVTSVDLRSDNKQGDYHYICADALHLPIVDNTFDIVICANLIEHVSAPGNLLREAIRVTKQGGVIYLSYPPFYSPRGGHLFSPFHYFGENAAVRLYKHTHRSQQDLDASSISRPKVTDYSNAFGKYGLYIMTIKKARNLIQENRLEIVAQTTRWLNINFSKIPILGEFLTWHVEYLLRKV